METILYNEIMCNMSLNFCLVTFQCNSILRELDVNLTTDGMKPQEYEHHFVLVYWFFKPNLIIFDNLCLHINFLDRAMRSVLLIIVVLLCYVMLSHAEVYLVDTCYPK